MIFTENFNINSDSLPVRKALMSERKQLEKLVVTRSPNNQKCKSQSPVHIKMKSDGWEDIMFLAFELNRNVKKMIREVRLPAHKHT